MDPISNAVPNSLEIGPESTHRLSHTGLAPTLTSSPLRYENERVSSLKRSKIDDLRPT